MYRSFRMKNFRCFKDLQINDLGRVNLIAGRIEPRPRHDGYRLFHWSHDPEDHWEDGQVYADWIAQQGQNPGELRNSPHEIPPELCQTSWCSDRTIDFIEADHDGKRWSN